jgi:PTH2 family peptidyl-tRNA hydrolase
MKRVASPFEYKLVIAVREDIEFSPGKMAAQVAHAAVMASLEARAKTAKWFSEWIREGQKKVVVRAESLGELKELEAAARRLKLSTAMVEDAGMTELPPGTVTCLGVGPGPNNIVDQVTGNLPLW